MSLLRSLYIPNEGMNKIFLFIILCFLSSINNDELYAYTTNDSNAYYFVNCKSFSRQNTPTFYQFYIIASIINYSINLLCCF